MKTLKLDHNLAEQVRQGKKTTTWRLFDEKNLSVDDRVELIDKVNPSDPSTWVVFGTATINSVAEKRIADITADDMIGHEPYNSVQDIVESYRSFYGDRVSLTTPIKLISFSFSPDMEAPLGGRSATEDQDLGQLKLYADGGSRGNPGPSAGGYVLLDMADNVVKSNGKFLGITTNNQAEYHSLKGGIEMAVSMGVKELDVYMDSLLVINQMKGIYKIRNKDLWPIHDAIKKLLPKFNKVTFTHVPRELNKLADAVVNETLDSTR